MDKRLLEQLKKLNIDLNKSEKEVLKDLEIKLKSRVDNDVYDKLTTLINQHYQSLKSVNSDKDLKKPLNFKLVGLIGVALLIVIYMSFFNKKKIDIFDYFLVEFSGEIDGQGYPEYYYDDFSDELMLDFLYSVELSFDKNGDLSNGETITLSLVDYDKKFLDDNKLKLKSKSKTYTVENLPVGLTFNQFLEVDYFYIQDELEDHVVEVYDDYRLDDYGFEDGARAMNYAGAISFYWDKPEYPEFIKTDDYLEPLVGGSLFSCIFEQIIPSNNYYAYCGVNSGIKIYNDYIDYGEVYYYLNFYTPINIKGDEKHLDAFDLLSKLKISNVVTKEDEIISKTYNIPDKKSNYEGSYQALLENFADFTINSRIDNTTNEGLIMIFSEILPFTKEYPKGLEEFYENMDVGYRVDFKVMSNILKKYYEYDLKESDLPKFNDDPTFPYGYKKDEKKMYYGLAIGRGGVPLERSYQTDYLQDNQLVVTLFEEGSPLIEMGIQEVSDYFILKYIERLD